MEVKNRFSKISSDKDIGNIEFQKLIFMSPDKQKEWDECDPRIKKMVTNHLNQYAEEMKFNCAVDGLCHVINDLSEKLDTLRKDFEYLSDMYWKDNG